MLISLLLVAGCVSTPTHEERLQNANSLARQAGWHGITLPTSPFKLHAFLPAEIQPTDLLSIYIEGDGLAWLSRRRISSNPTPLKPIALQMALQDQGATAYLARPCQYVTDNTACTPALWTSERFSNQVITASNAAINELKQRFHAKRLRLIGYSGGGAVAALLAARRNDVDQLITVAGNLDHASWTLHHGVSPLSGSLNPADEWQALQSIPQTHFVGADDNIIGRHVAESYRAHFPPDRQPEIRVISGADHHCCWNEQWPELLGSVKTDK